MDQEQQELYEQMRGEYLSLMASLEHTMTVLLMEWLDVQNHREKFYNWFMAAPIPFNYKLMLLDEILKENTTVPFRDICAQLRELHGFRNILAHSFRLGKSTLTARNKQIPAEHVTFDTLINKLDRVRLIENFVGHMLDIENEGLISPISADDFADWPL